MAAGGDWLSVGEVAAMAGIGRRSATAAVAAESWRGIALEVRTVKGRGGRSGRCYQVSLRSLSAALERPMSTALSVLAPTAQRLAVFKNQSERVAARFKAIEAAIGHERGTAGRAAEIRVEAAKGKHSERTLQRWIDLYEKHGMAGLARKLPQDAGKPRVVVSRVFDRAFRAAGQPEDLLAQIGGLVVVEAKGLWASTAEASGVNEVRRLLEFRLLELCEARGVELAPAAYRLSRRHVERFSEYRVVNLKKNNAKAFDDAKPRIRRDWTCYAPMEIVIADVKPIDVIVTRPDGSATWGKNIGFVDAGTGRIFCHLVMCAEGEGIRQEHVIEAFIAMTQQPLWGFPRALYLDNGSEFAGLEEKLRGALQLVNPAGVRTVIYARPYNASAKPIEGRFAMMDRYVYAQLPGYAGGERMHKKTQTVGRPPKPYPGSWDEFCTDHAMMVEDFNARPVGGQWGGRSPDEWLREKVQAGWRPIRVDPLALDAAFCKHDTRKARDGRVSIDGIGFHHPALSALPAGTTVALALPWRRGGEPLFQQRDGSWAYLERDYAMPALWEEGALESARRQAGQRRHVALLEQEAPPADPIAIKRRMVARLPVTTVAGRVDRLDTGGAATALVLAIGSASEPTPAQTPEERARALRDRRTARLMGEQRNVG
jgi:hypothetical protein